MEREQAVGMTAYVQPSIPGFTGILRQRYLPYLYILMPTDLDEALVFLKQWGRS